MTKLFIDDLRYAPDSSWDTVRNVAQAIEFISLYGCPEYISFDFYLGEGKNIIPLIEWLIDQDIRKKGNFFPNNFQFDSHSSSLSGSFQIYQLLNHYFSHKKSSD